MSKELEALKRIEDFMKVNAKHYKQDVEYIEKSLKALEIIKEKKVDVRYFMQLHINTEDRFNVDYYNENCVVKETDKLSQEDYDLLKEVLV